MTLTFKGTNNDKDVWIKSIIFRLEDGRHVPVNRNITQYIVENGQLTMSWKGCYIPEKHNNYSIKPSEFNKAELIMVNVNEEYAPRNYQIHISEWKAGE